VARLGRVGSNPTPGANFYELLNFWIARIFPILINELLNNEASFMGVVTLSSKSLEGVISQDVRESQA